MNATLSGPELLAFLRGERYAVQASVSPGGAPQAAVVGIVVSDRFEVFFDTLATSRKAVNLRTNPRIAFVIGPTAEGTDRTVQLEGLADEPFGADLDRLKQLYLERFPDGREREGWPGIVYFRVIPSFIRYSNFATDPPEVHEFRDEAIRELADRAALS